MNEKCQWLLFCAKAITFGLPMMNKSAMRSEEGMIQRNKTFVADYL